MYSCPVQPGDGNSHECEPVVILVLGTRLPRAITVCLHVGAVVHVKLRPTHAYALVWCRAIPPYNHEHVFGGSDAEGTGRKYGKFVCLDTRALPL